MYYMGSFRTSVDAFAFHSGGIISPHNLANLEKAKNKKHPHSDLHRDPWLSPILLRVGVQRVSITLYGYHMQRAQGNPKALTVAPKHRFLGYGTCLVLHKRYGVLFVCFVFVFRLPGR